ncbi:outer membrane protein assembly factor BamC [Vibrio tapetis subsp. quintayensis]|uniref:outer membrane protein assembly factor BamC n=1 Tax=Vibrio tapetis TaxID=52443 RepID=UPI0025B4D531|nr:outer membrane protein assembly factor BamC [Vibrio tapetis]MDN3682671.1 outer membrane protein assembly factor BamC [Vibrio tapetis subsp. quintayensis]
MKLSAQLVTGSLAVFVLSACSSDPSDRRQAKDDFSYLETPSLQQMVLPEEATPQFYPDFDIPSGDFHGDLGKSVDIRPPQQVLSLIPGARTELKDGLITLWLVKKEESDKVWQTTLAMIEHHNTGIRTQTESLIETDWVTWNSKDEDVELGSRYKIERFEANRRFGYKVELIDWREGNKVVPVSTANRARYNTLMTNLVMSAYDQNLRLEAEKRAEELVKHIPISMGKDRSGLPVIIARTPYDVLWRLMPEVLPTMGFEVEERNQSQGVIKVKYAEPNDEFWQSVGVKPFDMGGSKFEFLMGDLDNRTSVNITNSSGKPVSEEVLAEMVPVIATLIDRNAENKQ